MAPSIHRSNLILLSSARFTVQLLCITLIFLGTFQPVANVPKNLTLPKPELCATRKIHAKLSGHGYYVTWFEKNTRNLFLNWLDARNWCRDRCMDLVSLESPEEISLVKGLIKKGKVEYSWTSGRKCDFPGCERKDLQPIDINGWFWSGSDTKLRPTNERSKFNDWSPTGGLKKPQPDNRDGKQKNGYPEACLAYLNNYYKDGLKWHDVGCHHIKSFICEDSPTLLQYARATNKNKRIRF